MNAAAGIERLNSAKYLYLRELSEPRDNSLRLVVEEAIANRAGLPVAEPSLPELQGIFTEVCPIEPVEGCKAFEILWGSYVAYLVTEECVGSCGSFEDESYVGTLFRAYTKSHFLSHLARDTGGHTEPIQHFKLTCLNHLIDVAAYALPEIRLIHGIPSAAAIIR